MFITNHQGKDTLSDHLKHISTILTLIAKTVKLNLSLNCHGIIAQIGCSEVGIAKIDDR